MDEKNFYEFKNKALKKIKSLTLNIKALELENYNLSVKSNNNESKYNDNMKRMAEMQRQIHNFKKNEIKFLRQIEKYDNSISQLKQYFQLDNIEEITSYIKHNIIDKKAELEEKEKEKDLINREEVKIEGYPEELPEFLKPEKPKKPKL